MLINKIQAQITSHKITNKLLTTTKIMIEAIKLNKKAKTALLVKDKSLLNNKVQSVTGVRKSLPTIISVVMLNQLSLKIITIIIKI